MSRTHLLRTPRRLPQSWGLSFVGLIAMLVLVACGQETTATPEAAPVAGTIVGSVTLLGSDGPESPTGRLTLHASLEDLQYHRGMYGVMLQRRPGVARAYDFVLTGVKPGAYYVLACFSIGCGEYRDPATGVLRQIRVDSRRMSVLHFGL